MIARDSSAQQETPIKSSRLLLVAFAAAVAAATLASGSSGASSRTAVKIANPCKVISAAKVKAIFKLPALPSHSYQAQANLCSWFPSPTSQLSITLAIVAPQPGVSYAPGAKSPGVTIDKEPRYGKSAFMIIEPNQTFFDYQQADATWIQIQIPGASAATMLAFARAIHTLLH